MAGTFCTGCGREAVADARFCAGCGRALTGEPSSGPTGLPPPVATRAPAPVPPEANVFVLRPLVVRTMFEGLLSILTLGIVFLVLWIARLGRRYAVTTQRIETRLGIVTVRREYVDLFRIEDFEVVQPFFLRMRGAGNLVVRSLDQDDPITVLEAIPGVQEVYETLRRLVNDERARRRVMVVEGMQS